MTESSDRELIADASNPLGLDGIEFIEYATSQAAGAGPGARDDGLPPDRAPPLARGAAVPAGRHERRSSTRTRGALPRTVQPAETPVHRRRSRCACATPRAAYRRALDRGAWAVPTHVEVMELNIPAIHGVGASRIYFVDRYRDFSIYDVDFTPIPTVDPQPPALAGLHWFGIVQYIGNDRMDDWTEFYRELFGFAALPDEQRYGILPKGRILQEPVRQLLPAADRARARHPRRRARRVAAARRPRHAGRARRR